MIYGSVCSGIEAATVAWHSLGWKPAFFSEIEAFPRAVLKHHYPNVPLHGDFTTIGDDDYGPIDILVGGTPCQDFSIAGARAGLDGDRGGLTLAFADLAFRKRAKWLVWENVPGVFSNNDGRDFGTVIGCFAGYGEPFPTPKGGWKNAGVVPSSGPHGYGLAWRVLDAQYFGVPQRRRRVFIVGYLGDWRPAAAVLLERESLRRDPPPRREAGQGVAALTANGVGTCGADDNQGQAGHLIAHTLRGEGLDASEDGTGRGTPLVVHGSQDPITSEKAHPIGRNNGAENVCVIPVLEAGARTGKSTTDPRAGAGIGAAGDPMFTLQAGKQHAVAFAQNSRDELREMPYAGALSANPGMKQTSYIRTASAVRRLTPRECERLQGFPEVQKCYTILVCQGLSDQQKTNALAALQCRKLPSNAWRADASGWTLSAEAAAHHSSTSHQRPAPHVAADALIDLDRQAVRLHSAGRSLSLASNAVERSEFPLPTGIASFARLAALLTHVWEMATPDGRAESQANISPSSHLLSGSSIAISYGRETGEPASDVATAIETANRLSTCITLPSGLNTARPCTRS